jgi:hypothetical protein
MVSAVPGAALEQARHRVQHSTAGAGLLRRDGERSGRRGYELTLTPARRKLLDAPGHAVRDPCPNG